MSNLDIKPKWNTSINQIEPDEYIIGGPSGSINTAPRQLAENIFWLKGSVDTIQGTASSALSEAKDAKTSAQQANNTASSALNNSAEAKTSAQQANNTASSALNEAKQAKTGATEAKTIAQQAKNSATTALSDAGGAVASAQQANNTANSALSEAKQAKTSAQQAIGTVDGFIDENLDYRLIENRNDLEYNGLPATDGSFPNSLAEELSLNYEKSAGLHQRAKNIGECTINFTTEMSSNFTAPNLPWIRLGKAGYRRVLPVTFGYNLLNSAASLPLFKPTRTNGNGFLTFKYIGKKPMHTVITGGMHFLFKDTHSNEEGYVDIIPWLVPLNPPHSEVGQGSGKRALGFSGGYNLPRKTLVSDPVFLDLSFPISKDVVDYVNSDSFKNLYVGSDFGYISSAVNPNSEELVPEEEDGVIIENVKTTKWMDLLTNDNERRLYVMMVGGPEKSSRFRVQYKDVYGNIAYHKAISGNFSCHRLLRLPKEAVQVRIYYSAKTDDIKESDIKFGALPSSLSFEHDPLFGRWSERTVFINRDVVFYPNVEYAFEMYTTLSKDINNTSTSVVREWGFRFQSGGMRFLFDATDMTNELVGRAWSK